MNILITGTDGFIGSHLKNFLESNGHRIFGTVFFKNPQTNEIKFDITKDDDFERLPDLNFDAVIHTAGIVDQNAPGKTIHAVNADGTKKIAAWAKNRDVKHFIQASSITVYGLKVMGEDRTEDNTKRYRGPLTLPYGNSKTMAEEHVEKARIPYTILRLPAVFGSNDSYFSQAVIPRLNNGTFFFSGNKERRYSTLYIKNLAAIIERLLELGPQNDAFNCCDYDITWRRLIEEFAKELKVNVPKRKKSLFSILTNFKDKKHLLLLTFSRFGAHFPASKLQKRLNFAPPYPWQEGVKEAAKSYISKTITA